ncbi:PREDICTED: serpin-ZX-like [Fragaria vesca subsp. vesca]|uniref:serpin-ZX-like n=1 Tax=Fragaria vesca subsp. vesca TaxID=101020 RepID=UPI0002C33221|nr:PREDICTED: serpin-ZX-like [Fragaria vesca subsp. vesca]
MDNKDDGRRISYTPEQCTPYNPSSPVYTPSSSAYTPSSPGYTPTTPGSPEYNPSFPQYTPYSPYSTVYTPSSSAYSPTSPGSPEYHPSSPQYTPYPPPYTPYSTAYIPQVYHPTQQNGVPSYIPSPSLYSPSRYTAAGHTIMNSTHPPPSFKPSKELRESIKNQTDVALGITKHLLLTLGKDKNMVYSPLSIHIGLGMIMSGTKGHIQDQFLSFLKSKSINELNDLASNVYPLVFADGESKGGPRISFANGVWVEESLHVKPCFKEALDATYKGALNHVDFRTRAEEVRYEVNSWVDKKTSGLIKDILSPGSVSRKTDLILASALYFKGAWNEKFDESMTKEFDFHLQGGSSVKAPFMTSSRYQFISVFDSFKVLKLPYKHGEDYDRRFCMCVFLPNETDGLQALVERVCSESIDGYIPRTSVPVGKFLIPKFKISAEFDPLPVLKPLGFSFENGHLTEMVEGRAVALNMFQKSFIEVNEEGTEAAAVYITRGPGYSSGIDPPKPIPVDFVADHPFLYLIREDVTGTVMFVGHVLNPIKEK